MKDALKELTKQMNDVRRNIWTGIGAVAVVQIIVVPLILKMVDKLIK